MLKPLGVSTLSITESKIKFSIYSIAAGADGKLGRVDAQSPVQAQTSQPGQNQSGHQQTYMNPTIPPGYNYYYPGGMLPSGYSYTAPMFPVSD